MLSKAFVQKICNAVTKFLLQRVFGVVACLVVASPLCPCDEVGHCFATYKCCSTQAALKVSCKGTSAIPMKKQLERICERMYAA